MTASGAKENKLRKPRRKLAALLALIVISAVLVLAYMQFRGDLAPKTRLTMLASRAGLVMDPGSKVTYNGVSIGRVATVEEVQHDGRPMAKITLSVDPKYVPAIPANVVADITASTVFGNKYVTFTTPKNPAPQPITSADVIDVTSVTTEFNTLFETITSIAEKVDPVKLNMTLSAAAEALTGLGDKLGASIVNGNAILDDVNPQMPQIRHDIDQLANLAEVYTNASPDLWDFLNNAVTTAHTFNAQQGNLDSALLAAIGFGNTGSDVFERGGPYLERVIADLVPTTELLDTYSPELLCTVRNFHDLQPKVANILGGNGFSGSLTAIVLGAENPYVYPDNLPRVNARGGPGGKPGCWQKITTDLWPAPYLVMDTGASLAPYNHFELGQPLLTEYVWGRQIGENTINP
ncbi:MAG TPA: MCE family protein [Mycobacterium sp.]|jgi:phospholipid/cholesterol/gamma-HCH transport system substrate-binding protein